MLARVYATRPTVVVTVAELAPGATVTVAGRLIVAGWSLARLITTGTAVVRDKLTAQAIVSPVITVPGAQTKLDNCAGPSSESDALRVTPLALAVMVAV